MSNAPRRENWAAGERIARTRGSRINQTSRDWRLKQRPAPRKIFFLSPLRRGSENIYQSDMA